MSGASDKTEKPTPRKIQQAREQGQVAKSNDLNSAFVLIAATGILLSLGSYVYTNLHSMMIGTLMDLARYAKAPMTIPSVSSIVNSVAASIFWTLLPILLTVPLVAIMSNLMQVKPLFSIKAIQPKPDKINPLNGFKRVWSMRSVVEVVKAIIKMTVISWVGYNVISGHLGELMATQTLDVATAFSSILNVVAQIAIWSCAAFLVIGIIDWRYQAWELEKQLRMSKQEIKDERKSQDGDPMIKNRIRQMGAQLARSRQLAAVPTADVIITNPTHFAIAIKYDPDLAPAPVVVAKGMDHFAAKIREVAKANNVPMVENKPLARSLYKMAEVDAMIPPDLFVAVAEIMAYVFSKNKGRHLKRAKKSKS